MAGEVSFEDAIALQKEFAQELAAFQAEVFVVNQGVNANNAAHQARMAMSEKAGQSGRG